MGWKSLISFTSTPIEVHPSKKIRWKCITTKGFKRANFRLVICCFYSTLGYGCFWANSSPSGLGHSSSLKCCHMERLSWKIKRVQSLQYTGKELRSIWGMPIAYMKWLRTITLMNSEWSRSLRYCATLKNFFGSNPRYILYPKIHFYVLCRISRTLPVRFVFSFISFSLIH